MRTVLTFLFLLPLLSGVSASADGTITIDQLISLKELGYDDAAVIAELKRSGARWPTPTPAQLQALRKVGAGPALIGHLSGGGAPPVRPDPPPVRKDPRPAPEAPPSVGPAPPAWLTRIRGLLEAEDAAGAAPLIERALAEHPRSPDAWALKADLELSRKNTDGARQALARALALDADHALALNLRGVLVIDSDKQPLRALVDFAHARRVDARETWPDYNLGVILSQQGRADAGARHLAAFVRRAPVTKASAGALADARVALQTDAARRILQIEELIELGELDAAARELARARRLTPAEDGFAWVRVYLEADAALLALAGGRTADGLAALGRAIDGGYADPYALGLSARVVALAADPRFTAVYARMRIAPADHHELLWLHGELMSIGHDTNMMILESMNRQDGDWTPVVTVDVPARSTRSPSVVALRWILRRAQSQQRVLVLQSDMQRQSHLLKMDMYARMGSSGSPARTPLQIMRSAQQARERAQRRKAQVLARAYRPSGASTVPGPPPPFAQSRPPRELAAQQARALLQRGQAALGEHRYADARRLLQRAVELAPEPDTVIQLTQALIPLEQLPQAEAALDRLLRDHPTHVDGRLQRTYVRYLRKRWPEALADATEHIRLAPKSDLGYSNRSAVQLKLRRLKAAEADIRKALSLNQANAITWLNATALNCLTGDLENAQGTFERALQCGLTDLEAIEIEELAPLRRTELYRELIGSYRDALVVGLVEKARALIGATEYQAARRVLDRAATWAPRNADVALQRGVACFYLQRWADAERDFSLLIELNPAFATAWANRGAARIELGRAQEAAADCRKALALDEHSALARMNLAAALAHLGQHQAAAREAHASLAKEASWEPYVTLAACHAGQGRDARALACLELAAAFGIEHPDRLTREKGFARLLATPAGKRLLARLEGR